MANQDLLSRISINSEICHGQACIRGTRIMASIVLDCLAAGMLYEEIIEEYPSLAPQDIRAAIAYGAALAQEQALPLNSTLS